MAQAPTYLCHMPFEKEPSPQALEASCVSMQEKKAPADVVLRPFGSLRVTEDTCARQPCVHPVTAFSRLRLQKRLLGERSSSLPSVGAGVECLPRGVSLGLAASQ